MSDLTAAILGTQLDIGRQITDQRRTIWKRYHEAFADLEAQGLVQRPDLDPVSADCPQLCADLAEVVAHVAQA